MGRNKPSDPEQIRQRRLMRAAREAELQRTRARDPSEWGVSAEILTLPTSKETVSATVGNRGKIIAARRSDAFSLLHQAKRYDDNGQLVGGISDLQHKASERYFKDWVERAGLGDRRLALDRVDEDRPDSGGMAQRMVDAAKRLDAAHRLIGRADARLLMALTEPMVMRGEITVWRVAVERCTGESERHAQAACVRRALENLRLAYDELDGVAPREDEDYRARVSLWYAPPGEFGAGDESG